MTWLSETPGKQHQSATRQAIAQKPLHIHAFVRNMQWLLLPSVHLRGRESKHTNDTTRLRLLNAGKF